MRANPTEAWLSKTRGYAQMRILMTIALILVGFWQIYSASPAVSQTAPVGTARAEVWHIAELSFTSANVYDNPYQQVALDVHFTGPGGVTIVRPAFWDGGRVWRVRFAPSIPGIWKFTTIATTSKGTDDGLDHQTGDVTAEPYNGSIPIYKHGFLTASQNGHTLAYRDQTPFWWMSDVLSPADYLRVGESNKPFWNPPVAHPHSQIYGILDRRVEEKFTAIVYWFERPWKYSSAFKTPGDMIDVEKFESQFDPIIKKTAEDGLVSVILFGYTVHVLEERNQPGVDKMKTYARYLIARYGAYPVVWTAAEPDSDHGFPQPEAEDRWGNVLSYAASVDGSRQPIGPWYRQTAIPGSTLPTAYLNKSWVSLIITQCGAIPRVNVYDFYYNRYPKIPLVEAGGCGYEGFLYTNQSLVTDNITRRNAWLAVQEGSGGFGYGVDGVWCPNWDGTAASNMCPNVIRRNKKALSAWYTAIDAPGSREMSYLTAFYTNLPWADLEPLRGDKSILAQLNSHPINSDSLVAKADHGRNYVVVYIPAESPYLLNGADVAVFGLGQRQYAAQWYNPRTGVYTQIAHGAASTGPYKTWVIPRRPDSNDWVLLLKAGGEKH